MKLSDFKRLYNPTVRCFVKTSPNVDGFTVSGLIIDVQGEEVNAKTKVYVDNFYNLIHIKDIDSMTVTKAPWTRGKAL